MAGPGSNLTGTRSNNTVIHNASKRKPPVATWLGGTPVAPVADPLSQLGYANQVAGLQTGYAGALALQKANIARAKADAIMARQEARSSAVADMSAVVNSALDRGALGSSTDLNNRAAVLAKLAADRAAALGARNQAIGASKAETLGAMGQFYLGLGQVQAQQAMEQATLAIQQYQADQLGLLNQNFAAWQKYYRKKFRGRNRDIDPATAPGRLQVGTGPVPYKPLY